MHVCVVDLFYLGSLLIALDNAPWKSIMDNPVWLVYTGYKSELIQDPAGRILLASQLDT